MSDSICPPAIVVPESLLTEIDVAGKSGAGTPIARSCAERRLPATMHETTSPTARNPNVTIAERRMTCFCRSDHLTVESATCRTLECQSSTNLTKLRPRPDVAMNCPRINTNELGSVRQFGSGRCDGAILPANSANVAQLMAESHRKSLRADPNMGMNFFFSWYPTVDCRMLANTTLSSDDWAGIQG